MIIQADALFNFVASFMKIPRFFSGIALTLYEILIVGFQIRLAGSNARNSGRVEIAFNGEWGTICDSYWSDSDARVVCRQLGYVDGVAQAKGKYGPGTGRSWLYYVRCDGEEKNIWECTNSGWNVSHSSCRSHENDAVVYCTGEGKYK